MTIIVVPIRDMDQPRMKMRVALDRARKSNGADIVDSLIIATRGIDEQGYVLSKVFMFLLSISQFKLEDGWFDDYLEMDYLKSTARGVFLDFAYHIVCEEWP